MFSKRFQFQPEPDPLYLLLESKRGKKENVYDLTIANPLEVGIHYSKASLRQAFLEDFYLEYKPNPKGLLIARESISEYYQRRKRYVNSEHIFLTTGTSESISYLLKLFLNPGDILLVPSPGYPLFDWIAEMENVKIETYPSHYEENKNGFAVWKIDFDMLKLLARLKPKALVLVHPNNPTGMILSESDYLKLEEFLIQHNILLILDEVFADYIWSAQQSIPDPKQANTIVLSGVSKVLALPQLKLGWFYFTGSHSFIRESSEYMEIIADTFLSVSYPAQKALPALWEHQPSIQKLLAKRIEYNLSTLSLLDPNIFQPRIPPGGWYVPVEMNIEISEDVFARKLLDIENVLIHPGRMFQFPNGKWIVFSLLLPEEDFLISIGKLNSIVQKINS